MRYEEAVRPYLEGKLITAFGSSVGRHFLRDRFVCDEAEGLRKDSIASTARLGQASQGTNIQCGDNDGERGILPQLCGVRFVMAGKAFEPTPTWGMVGTSKAYSGRKWNQIML